MITRNRDVLAEGFVSTEALRSCLSEHMENAARLERLRDYYEGRHEIECRRRASGLPNNRLSHGFPHYISTMAAGYLIGDPVKYAADTENEAALKEVLRAYAKCSADSVDAELARDASVFGKGVELVFADGEAAPRTVALDPGSAFVVYDDTVAERPLFGVRMSVMRGADGAEKGFCVDVYTEYERRSYRVKEIGKIDASESDAVERHFFGGIPLVEYWNDEDERGDFEGVLSLIDAYDALESDRVNDKQQFVDALLLLYGCTLEEDAMGRSPGRQLREDKALALPDSEARAEWLCKQLNEADTEVLKNAIKADIHKMSMVPDLTDEQFAGNSSGVAMKYKLLGLEQLTKIKERWFREALKERLRLFGYFLSVKGAPALDAERVRMTFTRALPVNELETARMVQALDGIVPAEILLEQIPFVEDAQAAAEKMRVDAAEKAVVE